MKKTCMLTFILTGIFVPGTVQGQNAYAPDTPEPGSVEAIARFTTEPRFSSPWVAYVPESPTVPSPADVLGYIAGAAGELTHTDGIYRYFHELARASERVHLEVIGRSEEGRDILLIAVSDPELIRELPRLKEASAALADPRKTTPEEAQRLIRDARPFYYINAGLHADESGGSEMLMELVYRLAVSDMPMIQNIRSNVVLLVNPVSNPDGRAKMSEWFHRFLKGKTDYDTLPRQPPPYWGPYVFVDINRDAHQLTQEPTKAVHRMFHEYHPVTIHDLHESIAFLQTWNGTGPYNPHIDPIVTSAFLEMSFREVTALTAFGMPGVWTWNFGEGFGQHYLDSIAMNHNSIGRGYETYGNATGETVDRVLRSGVTRRQWYRPFPPGRTVKWSMRNNVNYQQTACLAVLDYAAKHRQEMLHNFYKTGYKSWRKGLEEEPFAFVIPEEQNDRLRVAQMVNLLLHQKIEVGRATATLDVEEGAFPAGTYVVRLDQPYRNYAVDLLTPQEFPEDDPNPPYDDISWALPVHYGVETIPIDDKTIQTASLEPIERDLQPTGRVNGSGLVFLLKDTGQEALLAARFQLAGFEIEIAEESFATDAGEYPAGSWILSSQEGLSTAVETVASKLALDFDATSTVPEVARHAAPKPRIGVWVPWADTDSIGWIRYTLDREEIPYTYLRDEEIRAGNLNHKVDIILYGNVLMDLPEQIHGIETKNGPMAFNKTAEYPGLGAPVSSDDITGDIGWKGMANLESFLEEGGLLITMGSGTKLALESGLARNVRADSIEGLSTPGVELRATFLQTEHPLAYGYPTTTTVFRSNYTVYELPRRWLTMAYCNPCLAGPVDKTPIVLEWGGEGAMVVSGGARKEEALAGRPALLDIPVGRGRVLAFNFNPMHRDLNRSDFRLLWNALLNWSYILGK